MIELKFDKDRLIPAVIQDCTNNEVLMMAYMNKEAVEKTLETKKTCFYSRSRKKLWIKGESSGHTQNVKEVLVDCDNDTLLIKVEQKGGACHEGYRSCFFRKLDEKGNEEKIVQEKVFDPKKIYKK